MTRPRLSATFAGVSRVERKRTPVVDDRQIVASAVVVCLTEAVLDIPGVGMLFRVEDKHLDNVSHPLGIDPLIPKGIHEAFREPIAGRSAELEITNCFAGSALVQGMLERGFQSRNSFVTRNRLSCEGPQSALLLDSSRITARK